MLVSQPVFLVANRYLGSIEENEFMTNSMDFHVMTMDYLNMLWSIKMKSKIH